MNRRGPYVIAALAALGVGLSLVLWGVRPAAASKGAGLPQRIVCAAPSLTELVFALGQGERVVGVTDYCTYPPDGVQDKARIGGLYDPNRERILKLDPDLIAFVGSFDALTALANDHGIATLSVKMGTLADIRASVRAVGHALGCSDEAATVLRRFDADLEKVRRRVASRPRRTVYLCTAHRPADLSKLGTCASDSFLGELLALAGGENVFADAIGSWPQISKETLLKRAPEVIIELHPKGMGTAPASFDDLRADWQRLRELPAVRRGEVHFLTDDHLFTPSVRAPLTAKRLAQVIHPEAYRE